MLHINKWEDCVERKNNQHTSFHLSALNQQYHIPVMDTAICSQERSSSLSYYVQKPALLYFWLLIFKFLNWSVMVHDYSASQRRAKLQFQAAVHYRLLGNGFRTKTFDMQLTQFICWWLCSVDHSFIFRWLLKGCITFFGLFLTLFLSQH